MESQDELKEIDIKNRACCCFNGIVRDFDINFDNILLNEKSYENISVYDISYKTSTGRKPLRIRLDKIDGFIRVRGSEFIHLVSFNYGLFDKICDKIKNILQVKKVILQIVLIIILEKSGLIHIILYLLKKC